jgi:hypothetical protein
MTTTMHLHLPAPPTVAPLFKTMLSKMAMRVPLRDVASALLLASPLLALVCVRARHLTHVRERARAYITRVRVWARARARAHPVRLWEATLACLLTHEEATCLNCIFFSILLR